MRHQRSRIYRILARHVTFRRFLPGTMRGYYLGIWIGGAIKSYIYGVEESRQVVEGRFVFSSDWH